MASRALVVASLALLTAHAAHAAEPTPRVAVAVHGPPSQKAELEAAVSKPGALAVDVRVVPLPNAGLSPAGSVLAEQISEARARYVEADFEGCLSRLPDEVALVDALGREDVVSASRVLLFRAACQAARGAAAEARTAADTFARFGLELPADVGAVAPDVERMLTDALRRERSAKRVSLRVESMPSSLEVLIDGRARGCVTPCAVDVSPGDHVVTVRGDGITPRSERTRVEGGGGRAILQTTPAAPALAAAQWSARYAAGRDVERSESLLLLTQAVRASRLAILAVRPLGAGRFELRGAYAVDGAVAARSGEESVAQSSLDAAGVRVLDDLLVRGKTLAPAPPIWKSAWFWTAVGVVAIGAATATALVLHQPEQKTELTF